jgi:hypothetical protein
MSIRAVEKTGEAEQQGDWETAGIKKKGIPGGIPMLISQLLFKKTD